MDISKASNFERFVFDLLGRDAARTRELFGADAGARRRLHARGRRVRAGHRSRRFRLRLRQQHACRPAGHHPRHLAALAHDDRHPHRRRPEGGARAPAARRADDRAGDRAAGQVRRHHPSRRWACDPEPPAALRGIEALPKRFTVMAADAGAVKRYIETHCAMNADARPLLSLDEALARLVAGAAPHAIAPDRDGVHLRRAGPRAGGRGAVGAGRAARGQHVDGRLRAARGRRAGRRHRAAGVAAHPGRHARRSRCSRARRRASSPAARCRPAPTPS